MSCLIGIRRLYNINMSDIINAIASNLMKIVYTAFNAIRDKSLACLDLTDYMYGFSNFGYEEAKYYLCLVAPV